MYVAGQVLAPLLLLPCWEMHHWDETGGLPRMAISDKWAVLTLLGSLLSCRRDPDLVLPRLGLRCLETFLGW